MRFSAVAASDWILPGFLALRARPLAARLDGALLSADERGAAGRMSLIAFAVRVLGAAIAFFSQVLLARWMGGFDYGIFVLVWTAVVLAGNLSCLGFSNATVRFIPEYLEKGDRPGLAGLLFGSRAVVLASSTLLAGAGMAGVWAFSGSFAAHYAVPFYLGLVCLPMIALSDTLAGMARANSWALLALAPAFLVRPLLLLALMGAALAAGYAPDAQTAIVAAILASWATALMQVVALGPRTAAQTAGAERSYRWREWFAVSLPLFMSAGFFYLMTNADVLLVGYFLEPQDVAVYFATVKTLVLVHFVYFAVRTGVAQRFAQYAHGRNRAGLDAFARETVGWTFWPSLAMGLVVLALGKPMLALFGEGFAAGYPLLFVLVAGVVALASVGPAESLLSMSGHHNACAAIMAVTLALSIALNVLLIPHYGLWGTALSTSFAWAFQAAAMAIAVRRKLGISMFVLVRPARQKGES